MKYGYLSTVKNPHKICLEYNIDEISAGTRDVSNSEQDVFRIDTASNSAPPAIEACPTSSLYYRYGARRDKLPELATPVHSLMLSRSAFF